MPTDRPIAVAASAPADDGLFGPESVSWRVFASPAASIGGATAVLMQMLLPRVVRMIDQASNVRADPTDRQRLTGEYLLTTTYGDVAAAERAGEVLRRIHQHRIATDPITGETYAADQPDLLLWVHASLVWAMLRACERWGPALTAAERDRFVDEQRIAARLVGIDPTVAPTSVAELDAYVKRMLPRLAYVADTRFMREMLVPSRLPFSVEGVAGLIITRAAVDLLPREHQDLYGYRWPQLNRALVGVGSAVAIGLIKANAPYEKVLPELRAQSAVHAFGGAAKRQRIDSESAKDRAAD